MSSSTLSLARNIGEQCLRRHWKLALAESCTGGLTAAAITEIAGSSQWFDRGFVTYRNQAKIELLNVPDTTISSFGAVSEQTARAMAEGALRHSDADIAAAITGIAGPGGGSASKPVGLVWFAYAQLHPELSLQSYSCIFTGDRQQIRQQAVLQVLTDIAKLLE